MTGSYLDFEGINLLSGFSKVVGKVLLRNELGYASNGYEISFAGGNSGYSFGGNQMDLSVNEKARTILKNVLKNAKNTKGELIFSDGEAFYNSHRLEIEASGNEEALSIPNQNLINQALSSLYGKNVLNEAFKDEVLDRIQYVEENIINTLEEGNIKKTLQSSEEIKTYLVDYHNQFGLSVNGKMHQFLQGKLVSTSQGTDMQLDDMILSDDIRLFVSRSLQSLQNPIAFKNRYDATANTLLEEGVGKYLSGNKKSQNFIGTKNKDTLIGHKGDDSCAGGENHDKYLFEPDDGHDIIDDSDGKGEIHYNGLQISGKARFLGEKCTDEKKWFISKSSILFVLKQQGGDLVITVDNVDKNTNSITIKDFDFMNGKLGITIPEEECNCEIQKRAETCENKEPVKATAWRDPNLVTFDKLQYDFQAPGHYTLVKGKGVNDTFEIQVRNKLLNPRVSVIDAVGIQLDDTKLTLMLPQEKLTPTVTPRPTIIPTPTPTPKPIDPFDVSGLRLQVGTSGNDELRAGGALFYGKEDYGRVIFSPVSGNITVIWADFANGDNPLGYYTINSDGTPKSGKILIDNPQFVRLGTSLTVDVNVTNTQWGYFLIPAGYTDANQQTGLVSGVNVTFSQINGEWSAFINGKALNNNKPSCRVFFSNAALNPGGKQYQYTHDESQVWVVGANCGGGGYTNVFSSAKEWVSSITIGDNFIGESYTKNAYLYYLGTDGVDYIFNLHTGGINLDRILFKNGTRDDIKFFPAVYAGTQRGTFIRTPQDRNGTAQGIFVYDKFPWEIEPLAFFENKHATTQIPTLTPTPTEIPSPCEDTIYINDVCTGVAPGKVKAIGNGLVRRGVEEPNEYTVLTSSGDGFTVRINSDHINVYPVLSRSRVNGTVEGLLGNSDGDTTNDLALRDGTILPRPIPETVLYGKYAEQWCVDKSKQLIKDRTGENISICDDKRFSKRYFTINDFLPKAIEVARQKAISFGFNQSNEMFDGIVFELLAGGVDVTGGPQGLGVDESDFYGVQELKVRTGRNNVNGGAVFVAVFFPVAIVVGGIVLTAYLCKHPEKLVAAKNKTLELGGKAKDKLIVAKDGLKWGCGKVKDGTLWGLGKAKDGIVKGGKKIWGGCKGLWNKYFGSSDQQQDVENQDDIQLEKQFNETEIHMQDKQQTPPPLPPKNKKYTTLEEKDVPQTPKGHDEVTELDIEGNEVVGNSNTPPQLPKKPIEFKHTQQYLASKKNTPFHTLKEEDDLVVEDSNGNTAMKTGGNSNILPFVKKEKPLLPPKPLRVGEVLESFLESKVAEEHFKENPNAEQDILEQLGKVLNYKENKGSHSLPQMKIDTRFDKETCFDKLVEAITLLIESKCDLKEDKDTSLKENVTEALSQAVEYLSKNRVIN